MTTLSKSLLAGCSVLICIAPDCSGENARDEVQLAFQEVKSAQEAAIARIFDHGKAQVRRRDWKGFASKLEELMRTEPDNVDVWKLAAWNQVYNLSAEDAESQYEGIKRAISILLRGIAVQPDNAILLHETAWYIGQKIGFDKDAMRMRSKLRNDAGLHGALAQYIDLSMAFGVDGKPDNWRISKLWYEKAVEAYDRDPRSIGAKSPVVFCSTVPMATFGYAMAIEAEGYCGQEAVEAWQNAVEELNKLAERPFKIERFDQSIRLGDLESLERELRSRGLEDPLQDEQYFLISNLRYWSISTSGFKDANWNKASNCEMPVARYI